MISTGGQGKRIDFIGEAFQFALKGGRVASFPREEATIAFRNAWHVGLCRHLVFCSECDEEGGET